MEIVLKDFRLIKIDRTNDAHINFIKEVDRDSDIKKYLFPYNDSFEDFMDTRFSGNDIFNNFFVIIYDNRIIGYIEIESFKEVKLNCALLRSERSKGLGSLLTRELIDYILVNYPNVLSVNTLIRNENKASIQAAINSGLEFIETKDGFTTYGKKR